MFQRREFLKKAGSAGAVALIGRDRTFAQLAGDTNSELQMISPSMELQLSADAPEFLNLNIDGLGKGRRGANAMDTRSAGGGFTATSERTSAGLHVAYRPKWTNEDASPPWTIEVTDKRIVATSQWSPGAEPVPLFLHFDLNQVHSTVLGRFQQDGLLAAPALIHFPGQGSMRLTASVSGIGLTYTSDLQHQAATLSLPGARETHPSVSYTFDLTAIYPSLPAIEDDPRFDAFRRNWLDVLQLNPKSQTLANNSASDTCAFCYYEYADIASLTPPLARGLTAFDLVKQTLERVLAGGQAYGLPGMTNYLITAASDTYPSLLIAAADCVRADGNDAWLAANYDGFRGWAESMLATDTSGNGLIKYGFSGNSGSWPDGFPKFRPSNWWDTIGFGYEDAYANALAYRAYGNMAVMAGKLGKTADAARYRAAAEKLRSVYYGHFFNPETGVLGGWRSADGQLHDYYFLWVNGIAIHYGLVEKPQATAIMDKLLAKMKEVGYDKFNMGLPGNLVTVLLKDYVHRTEDGRYGGGVKADNSDGWQNYENGGATGSFAFFMLAALYDLGRKEEADKILFPMLAEYGRCGFEGRDAKGNSNDWRRWDGTAKGYEGLLTDNYYALLAVPLRQSAIGWQSGFRPATALT
jgi:Bacterial alpha-L-rhamnosidase 6 hairpin glycosidase domain